MCLKCPYCIKVCSKCKRILVANEINFHKKKSGKYGLRADCKVCEKEYKREYSKKNKDKIKEYMKQYYEDNKEKINEINKIYNENNKDKIKEHKKQYYEDNKECFKEKYKEYREKNKDKIKEYMKQYQDDNKDKIKEYKKQYRENNPEYIKQYRENNPEKIFNQNQRRRQLEGEQGDGITNEQWLEMMNFFDWKCAYSGIEFSSHNKNKDRTIDHIIPLSEGGEHAIWNCVPMYANYNYSKRASNMEDWYIEQDFFDIDRFLKIYEWIEYAWNKWSE